MPASSAPPCLNRRTRRDHRDVRQRPGRGCSSACAARLPAASPCTTVQDRGAIELRACRRPCQTVELESTLSAKDQKVRIGRALVKSISKKFSVDIQRARAFEFSGGDHFGNHREIVRHCTVVLDHWYPR